MRHAITLKQSKSIDRKLWLRRWSPLFLIIFVAILLIPTIAYADIVKTMWGSLCRGMCEAVNAAYYNMWLNVNKVQENNILNDWEHLFGNNQASEQVYAITQTICNTAVKPIAGSILALVFLLQFIKMAGKADSNGTLPLFKEILVMFVFFLLFEYVVAHSEQILGGIYDLFRGIGLKITTGVPQLEPTQDFINANGHWDNPEYFADVDLGIVLQFWIMFGIFGNFCTFIAAMVASVMVLARALQLYIYSAFSPIPLSMLGFEETRSWGIGFFKNFAAIALSGVILLFVLLAFPLILNAVIANGSSISNSIPVEQLYKSANPAAVYAPDLLANFGKTLAVCVLLILACVKSGSWARDILGG